MKKRYVTVLLTMIGIWMFGIQTFGYWEEDSNGWRYQQPDGTYIADAWEWIDGNFDRLAELYYFTEDGYCLQGGIKDGRTLDENGAWTYRGVVQQWDLRELTGWYRLNGETMYMEEDGNIWRERITPDNIYVDNVGWKVWDSGIDEAMMAEKSRDCRYIVINKSTHYLERWENGEKTHSFVISSGYNKGDKVQSGDKRTPEGEFYVCQKNPNSNYHQALVLNYPTIEDAKRGLETGLINQGQHDAIVSANQRGGSPNWYTKLGGLIEIHGNRQPTDATQGCVGMRNEDVEILYAVTKVGDKVLIIP